VLVEPNIRWYYEVLLLSRSDVGELHFTQHFVLCSLWNTMKSCVPLCHHLKQEQYYYQKCVVILYNGAFEMAVVELVV